LWRNIVLALLYFSLEVVSKPQIRFKSKAQADEKAQSRLRRDEQYILKRFATQLLGLRWGFETTSSIAENLTNAQPNISITRLSFKRFSNHGFVLSTGAMTSCSYGITTGRTSNSHIMNHSNRVLFVGQEIRSDQPAFISSILSGFE
jgi:hypothetical protein